MKLHKPSPMTTKILPKNSGSSPSFAAASSAPRDPDGVTPCESISWNTTWLQSIFCVILCKSHVLVYSRPLACTKLKVDHFGESSQFLYWSSGLWWFVCVQDSFPSLPYSPFWSTCCYESFWLEMSGMDMQEACSTSSSIGRPWKIKCVTCAERRIKQVLLNSERRQTFHRIRSYNAWNVGQPTSQPSYHVSSSLLQDVPLDDHEGDAMVVEVEYLWSPTHLMCWCFANQMSNCQHVNVVHSFRSKHTIIYYLAI